MPTEPAASPIRLLDSSTLSPGVPAAAVPSWLVSLVVHLLVLVGLGLLRLPGDIDRPLVMLVATPHDQPVEPLHYIVQTDAYVSDLPAESHARQFQAFSSPSAKLVSVSDAAPVELAPASFQADAAKNNLGLVPAGDVLLTVVIPQRSRREASIQQRPQSLASSASPLDQVVHRFILYDVGELGGEAGQQARSEFEALGPDAIESLVRGLNASAYLSASCPVIVIESKLRSTLREANDPSLYRFAVEHIGQGVPAQAPYASRLAALRQNLAIESGLAAPEQARSVSPTDGQRRSQLLRGMRRTSARSLSRSLTSEDAEVRAAAVQTIGARGIQLVEELIPLLADPEPFVQQEAHQALVRLGRGIDLGPVAGSDEEQRQQAMLLWHDWWRQTRNHQGISEQSPQEADRQAAADKLRLARLLRQSGREDVAQLRLREIIDEFPDTPAATRAQQLLAP